MLCHTAVFSLNFIHLYINQLSQAVSNFINFSLKSNIPTGVTDLKNRVVNKSCKRNFMLYVLLITNYGVQKSFITHCYIRMIFFCTFDSLILDQETGQNA